MITDLHKYVSITIPEGAEGVSLVAVGGLANVHEAALYYSQNGPIHSREDVFYMATDALGLNEHFPIQEDDSDDEDEEWMPSPNRSLLPVLSGKWVGAPLCYEGDDFSGENRMVGAVLWHQETVGGTAESAARMIYHKICKQGKAGSYNAGDIRPFWELGGRVVHRMAWDDSKITNKVQYPLNHELSENSVKKLKYNTSHKRPCFLFTPVSTYFNSVFPLYSNLEENFPDGHKLIATDKHVWCSLFDQEYLSGRYLTTPITSHDNEHTLLGQAVHMIVLLTYEGPEDLQNANIAGVPIKQKEKLTSKVNPTKSSCHIKIKIPRRV